MGGGRRPERKTEQAERPPAGTVWEDQRWKPSRNGRPGAQVGGPGVMSQISEWVRSQGLRACTSTRMCWLSFNSNLNSLFSTGSTSLLHIMKVSETWMRAEHPFVRKINKPVWFRTQLGWEIFLKPIPRLRKSVLRQCKYPTFVFSHLLTWGFLSSVIHWIPAGLWNYSESNKLFWFGGNWISLRNYALPKK